VRRGDHDFIPDGRTKLFLGDRVRVVAPRDRMDEVSKFFGDSYKALSEVDVISLGVGVALGLALGLIPVPIPGGGSFKLGFAGGPLLVGLFLGALGRTGKIVWNIPYSANLTLRQIGLVMFLAGVGTRYGYSFASQLSEPSSLFIFVSGAAITCLSAFGVLFIGYKGLKIPMGRLIGVLAGIQTQPAALGFANEQTGNDMPNNGYTTVFPLVTIVKIVLAQILVMILSRPS
jgi:putative transport protein